MVKTLRTMTMPLPSLKCLINSFPTPHYYPWNTLVFFIEINYIYTHFLSETFYDKKFGTAAEILSYDLKTFEDIGTEPRPERGRGFSPHRVSRS
ncbi:MAG: hypothetical protein GY817_09115 [bacterium]|nr:hypothetical protein [bacterium]